MAVTENLGLAIIEPSDFVSPVPINENAAKLDALGLDYVTDQGTSGEWWYRKWKGGRMECGVDWKNFGNMSLTRNTVDGSYYTKQLSFGAYPFAFASRPFTIVSFEGDLNTENRLSWVGMRHSASTTTSPNFRIHDWGSADINPYCGIYVCGKWK